MKIGDTGSFKWYHGTRLHSEECDALVRLEQELGKPLEFLSEPINNSFGFTAYKGHVIALAAWNSGLTRIPDYISAFSQLVFLYLGKNQIDSIPDSLLELNCLVYLDLEFNSISKLPFWLGKLTSLKWLNLEGNNLTLVVNSPPMLGKQFTGLPSSLVPGVLKNRPLTYSLEEWEALVRKISRAFFYNQSMKEVDLVSYMFFKHWFWDKVHPMEQYGFTEEKVKSAIKFLKDEGYLVENSVGELIPGEKLSDS